MLGRRLLEVNTRGPGSNHGPVCFSTRQDNVVKTHLAGSPAAISYSKGRRGLSARVQEWVTNHQIPGGKIVSTVGLKTQGYGVN